MKVAVITSDYKNVSEYSKLGADAFIIGLKDFSSGYSNELTIDEIRSLREEYSKELFIAVNKNMFNDDLEELEKAMIQLDELNISGLLFYDIAVLSIHNRLNLKTPLVWNQTHMVTNYNTCNYYYDKGCEYGVIASEITLEEINEIKSKTKMKLFVNVLGYQVMGYSRRSLLSNYFKSINKPVEKDNYIIENNNEEYIVKEEKKGNAFLYGKPLNGSVVIKDLSADYIILNDYNFSKDVFSKALELFVNLVKTKEEKYVLELDNLIGDNRGFFFTKTIYKVKKNE